LETLDFFLLHNPEYYLDWCAKNGLALETARTEFYRRIRAAFEFLEQAVSRGRIRAYGISSNTFVSSADDPEFACLETVCEIAEDISSKHNFQLIQLPFNLFEPGAVLEPNQPGGQSVLGLAIQKNLGVLVNRPLNAFTGNRLIRLTDIEAPQRQDSDQIIGKIRAVQKSETRFWRRLLPELDIQDGLKTRIKQQISISDALKHYYLNFGSYENFRQYRDGHFLPHVNGVIDFLQQHVSDNETVTQWIESHMTIMSEAFDAVGSIYAEETEMQIRRIRRVVNEADNDWAGAVTTSRKAIRAVRSTAGVSAVLVGMRREGYVDDVVEELRQPARQADKTKSWEKLQRGLSDLRF
jgi:aryl-alcohol dehydrogenase-like predicted oxidoreductase